MFFSTHSPNPTPLIRRLTANDAAAYQTLRLEALTTNPDSFLATLAGEQEHSVTYFERELEAAHHSPMYGYYGVFVADVLAGYAYIDTSYLPKQRHLAFLYNLHIATAYRRQGLALRLCQEIFSLLKQQTQIELIFAACNGSNKSARSFYHQLGFRRCGIKPNAIKWQGKYDDEVELVFELASFKD
jgi:ribosomal protein S18 acetylase RimI-like enzyme